MSNENIETYLDEDEGNFIIQMPHNKFECQSVNALKQTNTRINELDGTNYYEVFYACKNNIPAYGFSSDNYVREQQYIKIGSSNFLVEKPNWLYEGPPPKPRIFKLVSNKDYKPGFVSETSIKITSPEWTEIGLGDMTGEWHCSAGGSSTYRLEPKRQKRKHRGGSKKKRNNKKTKKHIKRKTNKKHTRKTNKRINKRKRTRRHKV